MGQRHVPAALYPGKDPVPIVQEAGWAPGPVWTGAKNLAPFGIRVPDHPARSSVGMLPGPQLKCMKQINECALEFASHITSSAR